MNWKSEAIERLRKYESMKSAVQTIPDELRRLEMEAVSLKAVRTDRLSVKAGAEPDDPLLNNMVRREELACTLRQAQLWVQTTEQGLAELTPEDRHILHRLFISNSRGNIERLCQEIGCEQSTVYRKRDQAIYRFTIALYGFVETQFGRSPAK